MNRKEEMLALADRIDRGLGLNEGHFAPPLHEREWHAISAALRASAAPEEGISVDALRGTIANEWGSHLCYTDDTGYRRQCDPVGGRCRCADIARAIISTHALPSDSGKAAPVACARCGSQDSVHSVCKNCYPLLVAALAPATEEIIKDAFNEGVEIFNNFSDSIRQHGNYSTETTLTFIDNGLQCFRKALRALSPSPSVGTGTDDWSERLANRVNQLKNGGCKSISCDAVLGLIAFVRDGEGVAQPSARREDAAE